MPDNIIRNVLQWVTDTGSINKTVSDANKVGTVTIAQAKRQADAFTSARRITAEYDDVLGRLGPTASASLTILEQNMRDGAEETERLRKETEAAAREYDDLASSADKASTSVRQAASSGNTRRNRLDDIDRFGRFGTQVSGAFGGSDLGNAVGLIGDLSDGVSKFGIAGVAGAVALGAITLAQQEYTRTINIGKTALQGALNAQNVYYSALQSQTSEQAREDIAARQRNSELLRERIATLDAAIDNAFQQAQAQFGDAIARALQAGGQLPTAQLQEDLDNLTAELTTNEQAVGLLTQGLEDNRFAANDAAEAERRLTEARTQAAVDEADIRIRLRTTTAEERAERVRAIEDEIAILRRRADEEGKASEAGAVFEARITSLQQELELTANSAKTYGDALERLRQKEEAATARAEAVTERNNMFLEAAQREADARDKAAEISSKIADLAAERDSRLLELQADFEDRRTEVVAEGEDKRLEVAKDASDRIAKIERDRGRSVAEAIGDRDANAFRLANQRAQDALEDAQEAADKQVETTQKAQAKQLAALDKGYDKQVQSTVAAANKQISVQQRLYAEQLFLAEQARTSQLFLTQSGMAAVANATHTGWLNVETASINALNRIANHANAIGFGTSTFATPQVFPTLTNSIQGRALDSRIDQRLNYTLQLAGRSSRR